MNIAQTVCRALHGDMLVGGNACLVPGPGHGKDDRSLSVKNDPSNADGFVINSFAEDDPAACRDYVREAAGLPAWEATRKERPADPQFVYRDQHGEPYLRVTKVHRPGGKSFYQHSWNGSAWVKGAQQVRIPYRLPEVIAADTVYIVEGEKDADRLAGLGLVATSAPEGAGKWRDELNHWFTGKRVIILADNDEPGRKHADQVEAALKGTAASVRSVHFPMLPEKGDVSDYLDLGHGKDELLAYVAAQGRKPDPKPKGRFTLDWFGDIEDSMPKETFIKGVLAEGEYTVLSGLPGTGKSVILTDMACHVAAGMDWMGRKVKQGFVVYIAAERKALTKRRMLAFRKKHGLGAIPLLVLGGMIDLTTSTKDAEEIAATVTLAAEACGQPCSWIIVDTLTRTFGPGDQNHTKDMSKFIRSCDEIRERTGAHLTVVHHTAWSGERGKGAIDLDGAVDASFLVKKTAAGHMLECDGANDADDGVICHFRMEGVQVGADEDGDPTMAPIVVPADGKTEGEHLVASLKGHNAKALEVLTAICHEEGKASEDAWRAAFYAAYPGAKPDTLKVRFQRVRRALQDNGTVFLSNDMFSTEQPEHVPSCSDVPLEGGHQQQAERNGTHPLGCSDVPSDVPVKIEKEERPNAYAAAKDGEADDHPSPRGPDLGDAKADDTITEDDIPAFLKRGAA